MGLTTFLGGLGLRAFLGGGLILQRIVLGLRNFLGGHFWRQFDFSKNYFRFKEFLRRTFKGHFLEVCDTFFGYFLFFFLKVWICA